MQIRAKILFLFIALASISCNSPNAVQEIEEEVTIVKATSPTNSVISVDTSKAVVLDDIPIYGSFEDLKYIFEQKSDTTYVINFWATWCKPCVAELPFFQVLHEEFAEEKMRVILVSLDFPNKLESKLIPFINEHKLSSEVMVLMDDRYNDWIDKVDSEWDGGIPVTMVYNQKGKEFVRGNFESQEELSDLVGKFLKK